VNGTVHHFGATGFSNGMAVLGDRETRTDWDHITGEAFKGPLAGHQLDAWAIRMMTVQSALEEWPEMDVSLSTHRSFRRWLAQKIYPRFLQSRGFIPPPFFLSMSAPIDPRLDKLTQGLGVIVGKQARFYPLSAIPAGGVSDDWGGRTLRVEKNPLDGVPRARWADSADEPFQLLSRWYGFAFTYAGCDVFGVR
jgi:hypothetical protein